MSAKGAPNTFEHDFYQFIISRVEASDFTLPGNDLEYNRLDREHSEMIDKIVVAAGQNLYMQYEAIETAMTGIQIERAYVQGFIDSMKINNITMDIAVAGRGK